MNRIAVSLFILASSIALAGSQPTSEPVTRGSGGAMRTPLGYGIVMNEHSTLTREWIAVHDPIVPVRLVGTPGVSVVFQDRNFRYSAEFQVDVGVPVAAVEVRFITFDIWGERGQVLSTTEIRDYPIGTHRLTAQWRLFSENSATEYYASIAYVARVRTMDGRVIAANPANVLAEARRFSDKFVEADLEPQSGN